MSRLSELKVELKGEELDNFCLVCSLVMIFVRVLSFSCNVSKLGFLFMVWGDTIGVGIFFGKFYYCSFFCVFCLVRVFIVIVNREFR